MDNEKETAGAPAAGSVDQFIHRSTSRRDFLKMGGKGVAGVVLTSSLLSFLGASTAPGQGQKRVWATASGAIVHETARCSGCVRCETNCTMSNDGKAHPYISRVKIGRNLSFGAKGPMAAYWMNDGQLGNLKIDGETCRQCEDPFCGNACPVGAISADETTGARVVDEDKCIGCGLCARTCPWGMIVVDPEEKKSKKCVLCGGDPQCVKYCPNGALTFVPWDEVVKKYKEHWLGHI